MWFQKCDHDPGVLFENDKCKKRDLCARYARTGKVYK